MVESADCYRFGGFPGTAVKNLKPGSLIEFCVRVGVNLEAYRGEVLATGWGMTVQVDCVARREGDACEWLWLEEPVRLVLAGGCQVSVAVFG